MDVFLAYLSFSVSFSLGSLNKGFEEFSRCAMLVHRERTLILVVNKKVSDNCSSTIASDIFCSSEIVLTTACNIDYIEIPNCFASFFNRPSDSLSPMEDLGQAGFFDTGTETIATCFHHNGSF